MLSQPNRLTYITVLRWKDCYLNQGCHFDVLYRIQNLVHLKRSSAGLPRRPERVLWHSYLYSCSYLQHKYCLKKTCHFGIVELFTPVCLARFGIYLPATVGMVSVDDITTIKVIWSTSIDRNMQQGIYCRGSISTSASVETKLPRWCHIYMGITSLLNSHLPNVLGSDCMPNWAILTTRLDAWSSQLANVVQPQLFYTPL